MTGTGLFTTVLAVEELLAGNKSLMVLVAVTVLLSAPLVAVGRTTKVTVALA